MANVEGSIYRVENGVAVPYANLGGGEDVDMGVNIASLINFASTTIGQNVSLTDAFLYRFGRLSQLHITMRTTADLALNDCIGSVIFSVTDATGKLTPTYDDLNTGNVIGSAHVVSSMSSYASFWAIPIYSFSGNAPILMLTRDYNIEIQNASAGVKNGANIYIDLLFLNNYEG